MQRRGLARPQRSRRPFEFGERGCYRARGVEERQTIARQFGARAIPCEQRDAQLIFELANLARQRRLREMKAMSRACERAFFGDGDEGLKVSKVHALILPSAAACLGDAIPVSAGAKTV
jgi:hypothetical protein